MKIYQVKWGMHSEQEKYFLSSDKAEKFVKELRNAALLFGDYKMRLSVETVDVEET